MSRIAAPACRGSPHRISPIALLAAVALAYISAPEGAFASPAKGDPAPELSLQDMSGTKRRLDAYAGRTVIVHFFATWCAPCRGELASLDRLARSGPAAPVILAVDIGEPPARLLRFFETAPVSFPILIDEGRETLRSWGVEMLPTSVVVTAAGRIARVAEGPVDWTSPVAAAALARLDEPNLSLPPDQRLSGSEP